VNRLTKTILIIIVIVILLSAAALTAASFYFYDFAIKRDRKEFLMNNEKLQSDSGTEGKQATDYEYDPNWMENTGYETWTLLSEDGLKLTGYYIPAAVPTAKTVILAHGYTSQGRDMAMFAKFYREELGYNVLMPDARGHGDSEGDYIGFGWPERKDYLLWIQKLIDTVGPDARIVLHGISMGGATVMMVSGEELPSQVKVIVEDCGYSSVYDELSYQLKEMFGLPAFPILDSTSLLTKIKAGYGFYEASSVEQVKKAKVPMLFIHGSADTFVPTEMVYKVYDACSSEKELLIVEGAGHGMARWVDMEGYDNKVTEFLGKHMN
jgi:fermentation-respiration switch protein FrsA (DUF1100 family)